MLRLLLTLIVTVATISYGQTNVSGIISTDTEWLASGSPYHIAGNVGISGAVLTIAPGCSLVFESTYTIIALEGGSIFAQGTEDSIIVFTSDGSSHSRRIQFDQNSISTVFSADTTYISGTLFSFCDFVDLGTVGSYNGDNYNGNFVSYENLLFNNCSFYLLHATSYSTAVDNRGCKVVFNNCVFKDNVTRYAINGWYGSGERVYYNCLFENNTKSGSSYALFGAKSSLYNCELRGNIGELFHVWNSAPDTVFYLENCLLSNNSSKVLNNASKSHFKSCNFINNGLGFSSGSAGMTTFDSCLFQESAEDYFYSSNTATNVYRVSNSIIDIDANNLISASETGSNYSFTENYWTIKDPIKIHENITDNRDDFLKDSVIIVPLLTKAPQLISPTASLLESVRLYSDSLRETELDFLPIGSQVHISITANPYNYPFRSYTNLKIVNETTEDSIDIVLKETAISSGLYVGFFVTGDTTQQMEDIIAGSVDDTFSLVPYDVPELDRSLLGVEKIVSLQDLNIQGGGDLAHIISHSPNITFNYYDSMFEPQTHYQIQVSSTSDFSNIDMWDTGEVSSDSTSTIYVGNTLQDGQSYYLRARARSNGFWSAWSTLEFRMNTEPIAPTQLSLIGDEVTTNQVVIKIANSSDPEADELTYDLRLYADQELAVQLDSSIGTASGIDTTTWYVDIPLDDNARHWWTVQAYDGYEYSELTGPASFWINFENNDPAGFSLTSPLLDESIINQSPLFTWNPAVDPDPLDTVRYVLYLDTPDPGGETFYPGIDTSFQLDYNLEDNTTYHWKVVAHDLNDSETESNGGYQSFTVNTSNDLPLAFELLYPVYDEMVTNLQPKFLWEASSDPDDETIALRESGKGKFTEETSSGNNSITVITGYDLYLGTDALLTDAVPVEVIGTSFTPAEDLMENQVYYWAVSAVDDSGGVTFSDTTSFWTNGQNDIPEAFAMLEPVGAPLLELTSLVPTFVWNSSSDADLNDELTYRLNLGTSTWDMEEVYVGSDTTWTPTESLWDNTVYSWEVLAEDLSGAVRTAGIGDSIAFAHFHTNVENNNPEPAVLLSPDSVVVLTNMPTFIWERSFDPDPFESIEYEVHWWYEGSEWDSVITEETAVTIANPLIEDNQQYFWQVISMDDQGGVAQSEDYMFWVDFLPESPGLFALIGPEDESAGNSTLPNLTWYAAIDPDPFDNVHYQVTIATDSLMEDIVQEGIVILEDYTPSTDLENDTRYYWQVSALDEDSLETLSDIWTFDVGYLAIGDGISIPTEFVLDQNFPNPFNPSTTLRYGLPEDATVSLIIYDIRGNVVKTIDSGIQVAGWYEHTWNGLDESGQQVSTGLYLTRLQAGSYSKVIKMLFLK